VANLVAGLNGDVVAILNEGQKKETSKLSACLIFKLYFIMYPILFL